MAATWPPRVTVSSILIVLAILAVATNAASQTRQITFTKDVAPILQRVCQNCHRTGSMAPMALLTYEDVRPWAKTIKQKVVGRDMPPWFIDRRVGVRKFKDDHSLSDQEIATIAAWVDGGAVRGNPADMPPNRTFDDPDEWRIGKPDLIVTLPADHVVPAEASDWWGVYVADSGLTEDRYLAAVETKPGPGARAVVHHAITYVLEQDEHGNERSVFLNEYALGKNGDIFPANAGRLIKAGSKIRFQLHYHAIGAEVLDRSRVGLKFYPKGFEPKYVQITSTVGDSPEDLDIPAGEDNVRHDGYFKLEKAARLTSFQPHMHNRGKALCMEAILPDMRVQSLSCARFNFLWHLVYNYADDAAPLLPAGTILHVIAWHDNSAANKTNPDPKNWVGYGGRTIDEMSFAWVNYYYLSEEDYQQQVQARTKPITSHSRQ